MHKIYRLRRCKSANSEASARTANMSDSRSHGWTKWSSDTPRQHGTSAGVGNGYGIAVRGNRDWLLLFQFRKGDSLSCRSSGSTDQVAENFAKMADIHPTGRSRCVELYRNITDANRHIASLQSTIESKELS